MLTAPTADRELPKSLGETVAHENVEQFDLTRNQPNPWPSTELNARTGRKHISLISGYSATRNPGLGAFVTFASKQWLAHVGGGALVQLPLDVNIDGHEVGRYDPKVVADAQPLKASPAHPVFFVFTSKYESRSWQLNEEPDQASYTARLTGSVKFIKALVDIWALSSRDVTSLLGLEESKLPVVKNILRGVTSLSGKDSKGRVSVLFDIRKTLATLLQNVDVERRWIRENRNLLGDKSPLQLMTGSFEELLEARDFIFHIARR